MRKFPFPRIHGPDNDLCIRSIIRVLWNCTVLYFSDLVKRNFSKPSLDHHFKALFTRVARVKYIMLPSDLRVSQPIKTFSTVIC